MIVDFECKILTTITIPHCTVGGHPSGGGFMTTPLHLGFHQFHELAVTLLVPSTEEHWQCICYLTGRQAAHLFTNITRIQCITVWVMSKVGGACRVLCSNMGTDTTATKRGFKSILLRWCSMNTDRRKYSAHGIDCIRSCQISNTLSVEYKYAHRGLRDSGNGAEWDLWKLVILTFHNSWMQKWIYSFSCKNFTHSSLCSCLFSGMVTCLDEAIRNITQTLKLFDLYDNSVIIFSTGKIISSTSVWFRIMLEPLMYNFLGFWIVHILTNKNIYSAAVLIQGPVSLKVFLSFSILQRIKLHYR